MSQPSDDRPWLPMQLLAISLLFGPGAVGVVAGINFKRLGEPQFQLMCSIFGFVIFLVEALLLVFLLPEDIHRPVGIIINLATGAGFLLFQKPAFDTWKAANFKPISSKDQYRPNRIGLLFLTSLICLMIELGILFALFKIHDP